MASVSHRPASARRDFPFYDGRPIALASWRWLLVLTLVAIGFTALLGVPLLWPGPWGRWVSIALFVGLPLVGLRLAAGRHWTAVFPTPTWRDIGIGLAFVPVTMVVAAIIAVAVMQVSPTAANPSAAVLAKLQGADLALFVASTLPQLLGEELVTILPFLALLTAFHRGLALPRLASILLAWVISAALFGALHLPTYQWNAAQALLVIGASRLALSLPYLITKNIWASTVTHVTHDWSMFAVILAAHMLR
ncbi:MAG: CPBP family intramembrane metalloprotease [Alphaproteobacteria bacterium]|nr:CPBP family intramembrane metalloprotease [Alphaproteobacteria bacterium]MBU1516867.1 CPBP family intramembrane metalloprotease [Alphaproteobacteria bacterium]MBU2092562.1 CPBP family intramembrane metalloprotease [Alphaproteobacteria bacterium]MBU2151327.1 CPBP family intramembrane metalloprotease [Alphaproteobacteria bacterium]MBU2309629.1 CPBP family intramembrane metalloprotease [Alphaproteobacteria bacterium]